MEILFFGNYFLGGYANLTSLPKEIGNLVNLEKLDLSSSSNLATLPLEVKKSEKVKTFGFIKDKNI